MIATRGVERCLLWVSVLAIKNVSLLPLVSARLDDSGGRRSLGDGGIDVASPSEAPSIDSSPWPSLARSELPTLSTSAIPSNSPSPSIGSSPWPSDPRSEPPTLSTSAEPSTSPSKSPTDVPRQFNSPWPSLYPSELPTPQSTLISTQPSTFPSSAPSVSATDALTSNATSSGGEEEDGKGMTPLFPMSGDLPCEDYDPNTPRGIYYIKIPKTDTYYWRTIAMRNVARLESASPTPRSCYFRGSHDEASTLNLKNRDRDQSFLFTFIREPSDLLIREYFFFLVSKRGKTPRVNSMLRYLKRYPNNQVNYVRLEEDWEAYQAEGHGPRNATEVARAIVSEYDFIGIVEEPAKSLVVLRLLTGLDATDVLYNPSPHAGTKSFFKGNEGLCQPVVPHYVPRRVEEYIEQDWPRENQVEIELYKEVQKSIEATIDMVIGRDRFNDALQQHEAMMTRVVEECLPVVQYQCSEAGEPAGSCSRLGCDSECLESLMF